MKNGTTPGIDGLPPEFNKFFWNSINEHLINARNYQTWGQFNSGIGIDGQFGNWN